MDDWVTKYEPPEMPVAVLIFVKPKTPVKNTGAKKNTTTLINTLFYVFTTQTLC